MDSALPMLDFVFKWWMLHLKWWIVYSKRWIPHSKTRCSKAWGMPPAGAISSSLKTVFVTVVRLIYDCCCFFDWFWSVLARCSTDLTYCDCFLLTGFGIYLTYSSASDDDLAVGELQRIRGWILHSKWWFLHLKLYEFCNKNDEFNSQVNWRAAAEGAPKVRCYTKMMILQ